MRDSVEVSGGIVGPIGSVRAVEARAAMKLLLDTHIWILALQRPEKLGRAVRRQLDSEKNELYLSPISIWEAHYLVERRRLRIQPGFPEWLDRVFAQAPFEEALFNFAVAAEASRIVLPHPDPGDLFIAATALVFGLTLVTADPQLLECKWLNTMSND